MPPVVKKVRRKRLFCRSALKPWLAKTKLFFQKHTYHNEKNLHNFGVPGQYTAELGKNMMGQLKCLKFIAWPAMQQVDKTLMAVAVYNLGM